MELALNWFTRTLNSTIGQKVLVGLTGLGLVGFLITHLLGNLTIFQASATGAPSGLDDYAMALHSVPGLAFAEAGLFIAAILHVVLVMRLTMANKAARGGVGYAKPRSKRAKGAFEALAGRTMQFSGIIVLVFMVIHMAQMRAKRGLVHGAEASTTLSAIVMETLTNPIWAALYIVGSLLVGFHIFHGFHSAFRSLGFNHNKYTPFIEKGGYAIATVLALGFALIPIAILLSGTGINILPEALTSLGSSSAN